MSHPDRIESLIEARIRQARENGELDDLPGAGKPLPGYGEPYDENWWLRDFMRRESVRGDASLPPSITLKRDAERLPERIRAMPSEHRVRDAVAELNERIATYRVRPTHPFVSIRTVDAEAMVALWREARAEPRSPLGTDDGRVAPSRRRRWFRRTSRD